MNTQLREPGLREQFEKETGFPYIHGDGTMYMLWLEARLSTPEQVKPEPWKPINGEQVWIKVFSNWSKGTYIGLDADGLSHLVRESKEGGYNLFKSPKILPECDNPNQVKPERKGKICDGCIRDGGHVSFTNLPAGVSPYDAIKTAQKCSDCYLDQVKPEPINKS